MDDQAKLSRRERQIMDVIYARRKATANDVLRDLSDPPGYTAVRTLLRILERKGHLRHRKDGREFIYVPTSPRANVGKSAFGRVLRVFFDGSLEKALAAHMSDPDAELSADELRRLAHLIQDARKKGR